MEYCFVGKAIAINAALKILSLKTAGGRNEKIHTFTYLSKD